MSINYSGSVIPFSEHAPVTEHKVTRNRSALILPIEFMDTPNQYNIVGRGIVSRYWCFDVKLGEDGGVLHKDATQRLGSPMIGLHRMAMGLHVGSERHLGALEISRFTQRIQQAVTPFLLQQLIIHGQETIVQERRALEAASVLLDAAWKDLVADPAEF